MKGSFVLKSNSTKDEEPFQNMDFQNRNERPIGIRELRWE
jgi:hypothetical protein